MEKFFDEQAHIEDPELEKDSQEKLKIEKIPPENEVENAQRELKSMGVDFESLKPWERKEYSITEISNRVKLMQIIAPYQIKLTFLTLTKKHFIQKIRSNAENYFLVRII